MPKKLTLDEVKLYFENNQCKLISENYTTSKGPIEFMCKCGHTRKSTLTAIKTWKQFNCKDCTSNILTGNNNYTRESFFGIFIILYSFVL